MRFFVRNLQKKDFDTGYLDLLASKYYVGTLTLENRNDIFAKINSNKNHHIFVVESDGKIIGGATFLILFKLNENKKIGKIDDVVSNKELNYQEIEFELMNYISDIGKKEKCDEILLMQGNYFNSKYAGLNITMDSASHIDLKTDLF